MATQKLAVVLFNTVSKKFSVQFFNDAITNGNFQATLLDSNSGDSVIMNSFIINSDKKKISKPSLNSFIIPESIPAFSPSFGYLYQGYILNVSKSISAPGWQLPSPADFQSIIDFYSSDNKPGIHLKLSNLNFWSSNSTNNDNSSFFSAIGGGLRYSNGFFGEMLNFGTYLSNYKVNNSAVRTLSFQDSNPIPTIDDYQSSMGFSVRLRKASTLLSHGQFGSYIGNDGKKYRTVCIAGIEFLMSNLKETLFSDGTQIPIVESSIDWDGADNEPRMCAYENNYSFV